jgi:hypothetical protein
MEPLFRVGVERLDLRAAREEALEQQVSPASDLGDQQGQDVLFLALAVFHPQIDERDEDARAIPRPFQVV